jgi:hypothetical protein
MRAQPLDVVDPMRLNVVFGTGPLGLANSGYLAVGRRVLNDLEWRRSEDLDSAV